MDMAGPGLLCGLFQQRLAEARDSAANRGVMQEINFNGRRYRVEGAKVWTFLARADVHRDMQWGERAGHWRALPSNSPLRRYLVKIARGECVEMPRIQ